MRLQEQKEPLKIFFNDGTDEPLKEEMATHSNVLAWRIPWTEEPDWLQSVRVAKSWAGLKQLSTRPRHTHHTPYMRA